MISATTTARSQSDGGATTGYEAELWAMADTLRGSMDAAAWGGQAAEDRDEYIAENIFWVPQEARWAHLKAQARPPTVGQAVDRAVIAIERDNPALGYGGQET